MKSLALHWKILIGMLLGVTFGFIMLEVQGGGDFIASWIKPIGTIFVKLLKLIAVPLILASLIKGISDLKDISKFASIGLKTIIIYVLTTGLFVYYGREYIDLCKVLGKTNEANRAQKEVDTMVISIKENGWDGEWFLRAYDFYGNKIGSRENEEGKIFIESNG